MNTLQKFALGVAAGAALVGGATGAVIVADRRGRTVPKSVTARVARLKNAEYAYFPVQGASGMSRRTAWKTLVARYGSRGWHKAHTGGHWIWWRRKAKR